MKWFIKIIIFGIIICLSGISCQIYGQDNQNNQSDKPIIKFDENGENSNSKPDQETQQIETKILTKKELKTLAESMTVKVLSGENSGSGIIIAKQKDTYTIVTNHHVLIFGQENNSYKIITPDGKIYPATTIKNVDFHKNDLGLLQFNSKENYNLIDLKNSAKAVLNEEVYAAGFPYNSDNSINDKLNFTQGKINIINRLSFGGGYQIGYTNNIKKGMSGGPVFNNKGEIIAINGKHKYPLWGNPFIFEDGTIASPEKKEEMSQLSWAIPIQMLLKFSSEIAQKSP